VAAAWKALSAEDRKPYEAAAAAEKQVYQKEIEEWRRTHVDAAAPTREESQRTSEVATSTYHCQFSIFSNICNCYVPVSLLLTGALR
jgi:HMG (high mobility group) box